MRLLRPALLCLLAAALAGCSNYKYTGSLNIPPQVGRLTNTSMALAALPAPRRPINVAVYEFPDLTGQNKPNPIYADYSRAITQGAIAIVVDALKAAGSGAWFTVVERGVIDSLLRERKLIQDTYRALNKNPLEKIKELEFADYLITGGIISFDAPILSKNLDATYGGVGGSLSHSKNLVTITLRLVRVRDGKVLRSINASRPIVTAGAGIQASRALGRELLELQAGFTIAEATQTAVREAIEAAVYELVREGLALGLWSLPQQPEAPEPGPPPRPVEASLKLRA
jgi:curli production assembly/transport component CsgG